jgi:hypothetical protein
MTSRTPADINAALKRHGIRSFKTAPTAIYPNGRILIKSPCGDDLEMQQEFITPCIEEARAWALKRLAEQESQP